MARKLALVIGNSSYDDPGLAPLKAAEADVRELAGVLRTPQIGEFEEVVELANEGLAVVRRSIARFFAQARRDDLLLCYFSGHGIKDENGHLYLAVKDTEPQLLAGTSIEADFITAQMDRSHSKRQVLILDCCYSGAFADGAKGGGSDVVGTAPAFEGTGYGRVVLTATDSLQNAWQGDEVIGSEASVFTHYLLEGLRTGDADRDGDGLITTDELHEYIHEHVIKETSKQTPRRWNYKMEGDIIVARNPHPEAHAAELPLEVRALIESPLARLRAEAISELAALLHGRHRGLALAARRALADLRLDDSRRVAFAAEAVLGTLPPLEESIAAPPGDAERSREEAEGLAAEATRRLVQQTAAAQNRITDLLQRDELDQAEQALVQAEQESGDPTAFADLRRRLGDKQLDRRVGDVVAGARRDFAAGRHDHALAALDQFLPAHPLVARARAELTDALEQLRLDEERGRIETERLAGEREIASLVEAARSHLEQQQFAEALSVLHRAPRLDADTPQLTELIDAAEAGTVAAQQTERRRHESAGKLGDALTRFHQGDFSRALELAEEACQLDSQNLAAATLRDNIRRGLERQPGAVESAESAPPARVSSWSVLWLNARRLTTTLFARPRRPLLAGVVIGVIAAALLLLYRPLGDSSDDATALSGPATPVTTAPGPVTTRPSPESGVAAPSSAPAPAPPAANTGNDASQTAEAISRTETAAVAASRSASPDARTPPTVDPRIAGFLAQGDRLMAAVDFAGAGSAYDQAAQLGSAVGRARAERARQEGAAQAAAREKAAQDKLAQDKAAQDKSAQERAAQEKAAQERATQVRLRLTRAERFQDNGNYDEALREIGEALSLDKNNVEASRLRQRVLEAQRFEQGLRRGQ